MKTEKHILNKICNTCEKPYYNKYHMSKYCSQECSLEFYRKSKNIKTKGYTGNLEGEIWAYIPNTKKRYMISNLGRAKSMFRETIFKNIRKSYYPEQILKQCINVGYYGFAIRIDKKSVRLQTHRQIALAFIPNPDNKREVNHINGIKTDNRLENLEWVTSSENSIHAWALGLQKPQKGEDSSNAKLKKEDVIEIRRRKANGEKDSEIAKDFGVSRRNINAIHKRFSWKHLP